MMDRIEPDYIKIYGVEPYPATSYHNETFHRGPNCNLVHHGCMTWKKELMHKMSLHTSCIRMQYDRCDKSHSIINFWGKKISGETNYLRHPPGNPNHLKSRVFILLDNMQFSNKLRCGTKIIKQLWVANNNF